MSGNLLIKIGTAIPFGNGDKCVVERFIGGGGQGEVYQVKTNTGHYALKWYFKRNQKSTLKKSLEELVKKGNPSENFLWPKKIIEYKGQFGYIMDLRPSNYLKSQKLLDRGFSLTYEKVARAGLSLADSFRKLHVKGLSYQDISWGNLFIDPETGKVLICDNDNVTPHKSESTGISGTYGFMAPEVVRGERKPDQYSDLFSLAVLLFQMLFLEHPFNGRRWAKIACWDDYAKKKLYGTEPIFIFDPHNTENRPMQGVQDNANIFWNMYPKYIKDNFIKVFTVGLTDIENGRLLEEDWIEAFRILHESIFICPHCGRENIFEEDIAANHICWGPKCKQKLTIPPRIRIKMGKRQRNIMLNSDTKIHQYQLVSNEPDVVKGDMVIGEVTKSPTGKWGLRNLSDKTWYYSTNSVKDKAVESGKAFVLSNGLEINFGNVIGEII